MANFSVNISTTDPSVELGIRVHLDGTVVHENVHVKESYNFSHDISDDDGEHELAFELFGKDPKHTKVDDVGNIVEDAMLTITDIEFDEINVTESFTANSTYHHDFNGTQSPIVDKFFSNLGCNGTVNLKFTTPIYLWLLEHM